MGITKINGFVPRPIQHPPYSSGRWVFERCLKPVQVKVPIASDAVFEGGIKKGMDKVKQMVIDKVFHTMSENANAEKFVVEQSKDFMTDRLVFKGEAYVLTREDLIDLEKCILNSLAVDPETRRLLN